MTYPKSRRHRVLLLGVAAVTSSSTLIGSPVSAASTTSAPDIDIRGGNSLAEVVCGNVASAEALADQKGVRLQRTNCEATGTGGSTRLENVQIIIDRAAAVANADARALLAAARSSPPANAAATCRQLPGAPSKQRNLCRAQAKGGRVIMSGAKFVMDRADGTQTVTQRDYVVVPGERTGVATAKCDNVKSDVFDQRDDCKTQGTGGSLALRSVDVVEQNGATRNDIDITVQGGDGSANTYCFNVEDTEGRIVQINICKATGTGGDVHLNNVTIRTKQ